MKRYFIIVLLLSQVNSFAQSDTSSRRHLFIKIAPLTYAGIFGAIQLGLETNINARSTVAFDYAYGNSNLSSSGTNGTYIEGETCQRYRLEYRKYQRPFAMKSNHLNPFWGIELFNRTNVYPSITTIGRGNGSVGLDQYNYYERLSDDTVYKVWGTFVKLGLQEQISDRFWLEGYLGLGISQHTNTTGKYTLGPYDHVFTFDGYDKNFFFDFHSPLNSKFTGLDFLLSMKVNYRIF